MRFEGVGGERGLRMRSEEMKERKGRTIESKENDQPLKK
jgi:hypothetical protein